MTEQEWLGCREPERMLKAIREAISEDVVYLMTKFVMERVVSSRDRPREVGLACRQAQPQLN